MKNLFNLFWVVSALFFFLLGSCKEAPSGESEVTLNMDSVKMEIEALEATYATASNAQDIDGVAAYYANDAQVLAAGEPTRVGMDAIRAGIQKDFESDTTGNTISFEVTGVWACDNYATETGKSIIKDKSGNVVETGKYMILFEKRNGKYLAIREIYNRDAPEKAPMQ